MLYIVYCTSNRCDGHIVETLEGTLQEAIDWFYNRFDEVSVATERVTESSSNEDCLYPCLVSEERSEDDWWRYTMILWSSEI